MTAQIAAVGRACEPRAASAQSPDCTPSFRNRDDQERIHRIADLRMREDFVLIHGHTRGPVRGRPQQNERTKSYMDAHAPRHLYSGVPLPACGRPWWRCLFFYRRSQEVKQWY
jgi:hypothetical protein